MTQMTIAEALREVADVKGKIDDWSKRFGPAVFWYEEDPPAFEFANVRESMNMLVKRLVELQTAIAMANAATTLEWQGKTIPLALAVRTLSELKGAKKKVEILVVRNAEAGTEAQQEMDYDDEGKRFVKKTQRPWKCALPTAKQAALLDSLQEKFNKLNNAVETVNHKTLITDVVGLSDAAV